MFKFSKPNHNEKWPAPHCKCTVHCQYSLPGYSAQPMVFVWIGMLHKLNILLLQGPDIQTDFLYINQKFHNLNNPVLIQLFTSMGGICIKNWRIIQHRPIIYHITSTSPCTVNSIQLQVQKKYVQGKFKKTLFSYSWKFFFFIYALPGQKHGMLIVNIVVCHSMVQHPLLSSQILNSSVKNTL